MGAVLHQSADPDGFTIEMAEHLLPDHTRYELHGGRIVVMSPARLWHIRVQHRLMSFLERQGKLAGTEIGLTIAPRETRVLDVAAFHGEPDEDRAYFRADEIALAVEVVSPSSQDDDYIDKPALYARLGIPEFWRVDRTSDSNEPMIEMFTLDADRRVYVPARTISLDELEQAG
jgi:Uma2 family endonuclease